MIDVLTPLTVSLLIGLLNGLEREKAHAGRRSTMGLRTFLLISLLGALAGWIEEPWMAGLIGAFVFSLITVSYAMQRLRSTHDATQDERIGLTTEVAAGIVFTLGFLSHREITIVAFLGPLLALILYAKPQLHRFADQLKPVELQSALILLLLGAGVISLLPNEPIDPWDLINPRKIGLIILALSAIEFASYVAVKLFGHTKGYLIVGFFAGMVSSTAVLLNGARDAKKSPEKWRVAATKSVSAKLGSFLVLLIVIGLANLQLLSGIAAPLALASLIGAIAAWWLARSGSDRKSSDFPLPSPLDLKSAFRLGLILAVLLVAVALVQRQVGNQGTYIFTFVAGLFELQGVSLAMATLMTSGKLQVSTAQTSIAVAVLASLFSKIVLSALIERGRFALVVSSIFLTMGVAYGATHGILLYFFNS